MKSQFLFLLFFTSVLGYPQGNQKLVVPRTYNEVVKKQKLSEKETLKWHHKDIIKDTIPGISLQRAYELLHKKKVKDTIIVAVLDTPIDINHEDLKGQIWLNKNEIPNNDIDEDKNGYIDDINGWNFLGNNKGEQNIFMHFESTRIIKKYKDLFNDVKTVHHAQNKDSVLFRLYTKAKSKYDEQLKSAIEDSSYANMLARISKNAKKPLSIYFPKHDLDILWILTPILVILTPL